MVTCITQTMFLTTQCFSASSIFFYLYIFYFSILFNVNNVWFFSFSLHFIFRRLLFSFSYYFACTVSTVDICRTQLLLPVCYKRFHFFWAVCAWWRKILEENEKNTHTNLKRFLQHPNRRSKLDWKETDVKRGSIIESIALFLSIHWFSSLPASNEVSSIKYIVVIFLPKKKSSFIFLHLLAKFSVFLSSKKNIYKFFISTIHSRMYLVEHIFFVYLLLLLEMCVRTVFLSSIDESIDRLTFTQIVESGPLHTRRRFSTYYVSITNMCTCFNVCVCVYAFQSTERFRSFIRSFVRSFRRTWFNFSLFYLCVSFSLSSLLFSSCSIE